MHDIILYNAQMLLDRGFSFTVGFPAIRVSVTPRMSPDIFSAIIDLSTSHGKKGKKRGKVITSHYRVTVYTHSFPVNNL